MNNMTTSQRYFKNRNSKNTFFFFKKYNYNNLLEQEMEILKMLENLREEFKYVNHCLDYVTEPLLIDSYIYQLLSINMKYEFYLQLCKEMGLIADIL